MAAGLSSMEPAQTDVDIAVCGAGPVGMALAALLVARGTPAARVALIDARTEEQAARDPRSIALSYGSRQILEEVQAWPARCNPIRQIHVSRRRHFGRALIEAAEYGVPELGYVCRYGELVSALAGAVGRLGIASLRPARVSAIVEQPDSVALRLADGRSLSTSIAVQAEGGLFPEQTVKPLNRDYRQTAVIAEVSVSAPIKDRAFERFTDEGPLALLPQDDGYALVWCVRPASAQRLLAMPEATFLSELQQAFGQRLGSFTGASPRNAFPLGLNAHAAVSARTVAIGNAAQTLHPVAGQGLNLGLRDAAILARLLSQQAAPAMLERFVTARRSDRSLTIALTDTMARIFASAPDGAFTQSLLGLSLATIDAIQPAKRLLAEQMMFGRR